MVFVKEKPIGRESVEDMVVVISSIGGLFLFGIMSDDVVFRKMAEALLSWSCPSYNDCSRAQFEARIL